MNADNDERQRAQVKTVSAPIWQWEALAKLGISPSALFQAAASDAIGQFDKAAILRELKACRERMAALEQHLATVQDLQPALQAHPVQWYVEAAEGRTEGQYRDFLRAHKDELAQHGLSPARILHIRRGL